MCASEQKGSPLQLLLCHSCLKIIPTRPLRHVWPEVVMENHTHTPAVHGKSHTSTCALKLSSTFKIMISYPMLIRRVFYHNSSKQNSLNQRRLINLKKKLRGNSIPTLVLKSFPLNVVIWQVFTYNLNFWHFCAKISWMVIEKLVKSMQKEKKSKFK